MTDTLEAIDLLMSLMTPEQVGEWLRAAALAEAELEKAARDD